MIPSSFRDYLIAHGAARTAHSGYTLWDHLSGVHRILRACASESDVCNAGLFHSVYGTRAFQTVTVGAEKRPELQALIGARAECLAWTFCGLPRPQLLETSLRQKTFGWLDQLRVDHQDISRIRDDLLRLECANLLEQKKLHEYPFLARHAQVIGMLDKDGFSIG